jgi:hypothetical protein
MSQGVFDARRRGTCVLQLFLTRFKLILPHGGVHKVFQHRMAIPKQSGVLFGETRRVMQWISTGRPDDVRWIAHDDDNVM